MTLLTLLQSQRAARKHKRTPGCPCCEDPCVIAADNFRADNLDTHYTIDPAERSHVAVVSEHLEIDDDGVEVIHNTPHPDAPYPSLVKLLVKGEAGSICRVLLRYDPDDGSCLIAELTISDHCGELNLYETDGVTETLIAGPTPVPTAGAGTWHTWEVWYDPDADPDPLFASWCRSGLLISVGINQLYETAYLDAVPTFVPTGLQVGMATAAGHTGVAQFDDFFFDYLWYLDAELNKVWCGGQNTGCVWAAGHFGNTAYLDCDWQTVVGETWTIDDVAETLSTDETTAILLHRASYPFDDFTTLPHDGTKPWDGYHDHRLVVSFEVEDAARVVLLIVAAADTSNYVAAKLALGVGDNAACGTMQLVQVVAGVETAISLEHQIPYLIPGFRVWAFLEYLEGRVKLHLSNTSAMPIVIDYEVDEFPCVGDPPTADGGELWARQLWSDDDTAPYAGGYVGVGVDGGTGAFSVYSFGAGCVGIIDCCDLEIDRFRYNGDDWQQCQWTKISGDWPTRTLSGDLGTLEFTSAALLLHNNPVMARYEAYHRVRGTFISSDSGDKWGIVFGSDAAGSNYWLAEIDRTASRLNLIEVVAGTPTTRAYAGSALPGTEILAQCYGGIILIRAGSVAAAYTGNPKGPYWGLKVTPAGTVTAHLATSRRIADGLNVEWEELDCLPFPAPCGNCTDSNFPIEFGLTIAGLEDATCDCQGLDGTYYAYINPLYVGTVYCRADGGPYQVYPDPGGNDKCTGAVTVAVYLGSASTFVSSYALGTTYPSLPSGVWLFFLLKIHTRNSGGTAGYLAFIWGIELVTGSGNVCSWSAAPATFLASAIKNSIYPSDYGCGLIDGVGNPYTNATLSVTSTP